MTGIHRLSFAALGAWLAVAALPARAHTQFPVAQKGLHLVAIPTTDTVPAGPGPVQYRLYDGEDSARVIYGQVVRVRRVGGQDAPALPVAVDRVVLVPWGEGLNQQAFRWGGSAVWTTPDWTGLFWGTLRPREQWADGMPTVDVREPHKLPFPWRLTIIGPYPPRDSILTAEQGLDLMERLPLPGAEQADREAAAGPVVQWSREHPELAGLYPADWLVRAFSADIRFARLKRIDPPLAGTYRFTVSVDGDAPRTFFGRARAAPAAEWNPWARHERDFVPHADAPLNGYSLQLAGASSLDSLPVVVVPDAERDGYLSLLAAPEPGPDGEVWRGTVQWDLLRRQFPADSVLVSAANAGRSRQSDRWRAGDSPEILARIVLRPDGSVSVEQRSVLDDGRTVVIHGERISRVTIPEPDPPRR